MNDNNIQKFNLKKNALISLGIYIFPDQWVNSKFKYAITCPNGHEYNARWDNINPENGCKICKRKEDMLIKIKKELDKYKLTLLSNEWIGQEAEYEIECVKGHKSKIKWENFKRGTGCKKCKYNYDKYASVKQKVEEDGYSFISTEWKGALEQYIFKCPEGHVYSTRWINFKDGKRCPLCYKLKSKNKTGNCEVPINKIELQRKVIEDKFKKSLLAERYEFEDFEYKARNIKIDVICPNDHNWSVNWASWLSGKRCRKCFELRARKSSLEISSELELSGCQLVGEYYGSEKSFNYICSCGNPSRIRIGDFRRGVRCHRCGGEKARETNRLIRLEKLKEFERSIE